MSGIGAQNFFDIAELEQSRTKSGKSYLEFLRESSLSAGVYVLSAGSADPQKPHREDEMYYVVRGSAACELAGKIKQWRQAALFLWRQTYRTAFTKSRRS